jgi:thymidylate synthase
MSTRVITAWNVNHAFTDGLMWLREAGIEEQSRNGPVLVAPGPVITEYMNPRNRVLFDATRDANPVFHLMEAIWMLAGDNQAEFLIPFNSRFKEYSEDNGLVHGAYGYRWRYHFGHDQIESVVNELRAKPASRQAVIGMWDPARDQGVSKRDVPCNTTIYFDRRGGVLNMTVCCRSNDMLWGAYGANVVHFSILQELIALGLEIPVGEYRQFSNNFHIYTELPMVKTLLATPPVPWDPYSTGECASMPLINIDSSETWQDFVDDCEKLISPDGGEYATEFFKRVARPLFRAYMHRKNKLPYGKILTELPQDVDWVLAFKHWLARRDE